MIFYYDILSGIKHIFIFHRLQVYKIRFCVRWLPVYEEILFDIYYRFVLCVQFIYNVIYDSFKLAYWEIFFYNAHTFIHLNGIDTCECVILWQFYKIYHITHIFVGSNSSLNDTYHYDFLKLVYLYKFSHIWGCHTYRFTYLLPHVYGEYVHISYIKF